MVSFLSHHQDEEIVADCVEAEDTNNDPVHVDIPLPVPVCFICFAYSCFQILIVLRTLPFPYLTRHIRLLSQPAAH